MISIAMRPPVKEMPPNIRALIDAAVDSGKVQTIPTGVSGLPGYRWDDAVKSIVREGGPAPSRASAGLRALRLRRSTAAAERRAVVLSLRAEGLTRQQIADRMDITLETVIRLVKQAYRLGEISK